jgi:hypothetical protein
MGNKNERFEETLQEVTYGWKEWLLRLEHVWFYDEVYACTHIIFSRTPCLFDISVSLSNQGHIDMSDMCVSTTFMFPHNNSCHWVVVLIARTVWFNLIIFTIVKKNWTFYATWKLGQVVLEKLPTISQANPTTPATLIYV